MLGKASTRFDTQIGKAGFAGCGRCAELHAVRNPQTPTHIGPVAGKAIQMDIYWILVYATDEDGQLSRPREVVVRTGWRLFLPVVRK